MVFLEGLIQEEELEKYKKKGYIVDGVYHTIEEAQKAEPGKFDDDSAIGEDGLVWARIYIDCDMEVLLDVNEESLKN